MIINDDVGNGHYCWWWPHSIDIIWHILLYIEALDDSSKPMTEGYNDVMCDLLLFTGNAGNYDDIHSITMTIVDDDDCLMMMKSWWNMMMMTVIYRDDDDGNLFPGNHCYLTITPFLCVGGRIAETTYYHSPPRGSILLTAYDVGKPLMTIVGRVYCVALMTLILINDRGDWYNYGILKKFDIDD